MVAGAIAYGLTAQNSGFRLSAVGVLLMITGPAGFVVSMFVFLMLRHSLAPTLTTVEQITSNPVGELTELR